MSTRGEGMEHSCRVCASPPVGLLGPEVGPVLSLNDSAGMGVPLCVPTAEQESAPCRHLEFASLTFSHSEDPVRLQKILPSVSYKIIPGKMLAGVLANESLWFSFRFQENRKLGP